MNLKKFFKSFYYAYTGFKTGLDGRNFKVHLVCALLAVLMSIYFKISTVEWLFVVISIAAVISAELFNTAIEEVCNILNKHLKLDYLETWNPRNLAAGAVLVISIAAFIVGLLIFLPRLINLFLGN